MKTKYHGGDGHSGRSVQLDRNPRVLDYDDAGTDHGVRIVTLVEGFAFEDAARNPGDDPDARNALHSKGFASVRSALDAINSADRCFCGRCTK